MEKSRIDSFCGATDVNTFITKVELYASLKGYTGEKAAQFLASRLDGAAFDVYMRLEVGEKKDADKLKEELRKEFEKGKSDREVALNELSNRRRKPEEAATTFAYKLDVLVTLAYPNFDAPAKNTIARDYFMRGLHPEMQLALKASEKFSAIVDTKVLANEVTRLQLAGIKSFANIPVSVNNIGATGKSLSTDSIELHNTENFVDTIVAKVTSEIERKLNLRDRDGGSDIPVNAARGGFDGYNSGASYRGRYDGAFRARARGGYGGGFSGAYRGARGGGYRGARSDGNNTLKCRSCQSTSHLVRACPQRYCQACGSQGHDSWDVNCPKFQ